MTKLKFLLSLGEGLSGLPEEEIEERLTFYDEMISDRMEEGLSEEEAVDAIGPVNEIISQIIADIPFSKLFKEKMKPKRKLRAWEIILLAVGSPIWLSLLIAAFAVVLSLYAVLWSLIISLWAVEASLWGTTLAGIISGAFFAVCSNTMTGIAVIGAAIFSAGISIFMFFGCKAATKGIVLLTKKLAIAIKSCFIKKEDA